MRLVRYAPLVVSTLLFAAVASAWLASRGAAEQTGFAGATSVALWFLGFALLAFVFAGVSAGVALARRKQLTWREKLAGMLPFPVLITALVIALFVIQ